MPAIDVRPSGFKWLGLAKNRLNQIRDLAALMGTPVYSQVLKPEPGTLIRVNTVFGGDHIRIESGQGVDFVGMYAADHGFSMAGFRDGEQIFFVDRVNTDSYQSPPRVHVSPDGSRVFVWSRPQGDRVTYRDEPVSVDTPAVYDLTLPIQADIRGIAANGVNQMSATVASEGKSYTDWLTAIAAAVNANSRALFTATAISGGVRVTAKPELGVFMNETSLSLGGTLNGMVSFGSDVMMTAALVQYGTPTTVECGWRFSESTPSSLDATVFSFGSYAELLASSTPSPGWVGQLYGAQQWGPVASCTITYSGVEFERTGFSVREVRMRRFFVNANPTPSHTFGPDTWEDTNVQAFPYSLQGYNSGFSLFLSAPTQPPAETLRKFRPVYEMVSRVNRPFTIDVYDSQGTRLERHESVAYTSSTPGRGFAAPDSSFSSNPYWVGPHPLFNGDGSRVFLVVAIPNDGKSSFGTGYHHDLFYYEAGRGLFRCRELVSTAWSGFASLRYGANSARDLFRLVGTRAVGAGSELFVETVQVDRAADGSPVFVSAEESLLTLGYSGFAVPIMFVSSTGGYLVVSSRLKNQSDTSLSAFAFWQGQAPIELYTHSGSMSFWGNGPAEVLSSSDLIALAFTRDAIPLSPLFKYRNGAWAIVGDGAGFNPAAFVSRDGGVTGYFGDSGFTIDRDGVAYTGSAVANAMHSQFSTPSTTGDLVRSCLLSASPKSGWQGLKESRAEFSSDGKFTAYGPVMTPAQIRQTLEGGETLWTWGSRYLWPQG